MRIAVDAMGSDDAPAPEVKGAVQALAAYGAGDPFDLVLVGNQSKLEAALAAYPRTPRISIVHADDVIAMHDNPVTAVRQKKMSSLMVAMRLVKQGEADAVLSAGNTGAVMLGARIVLGPIKGVARPAIGQAMPTLKQPVFVLDLGANAECSARHLCEFAEMGVLYARDVMDIENPRVGLLNIGEEQLKGSSLYKAVHRTLSATPHLNFIGNVEPKAMYSGAADVVVCDGFVGNVVLKTSEAVSIGLRAAVKDELKSSWISMLGAALCMGAYKRLKKRIDPDEYGAAPLLGTNGVVFILHGATTAQGMASGIRAAVHAVNAGINEHIRRGIGEMRSAAGYADEQEDSGE